MCENSLCWFESAPTGFVLCIHCSCQKSQGRSSPFPFSPSDLRFIDLYHSSPSSSFSRQISHPSKEKSTSVVIFPSLLSISSNQWLYSSNFYHRLPTHIFTKCTMGSWHFHMSDFCQIPFFFHIALCLEYVSKRVGALKQQGFPFAFFLPNSG